MLITCVFMFLLFIQDRIAEQRCGTIKETELVMAFLVHRHGDRAPVAKELFLSENPEQLAQMTEPFGYSHLTKVGKARSFLLGQFLRRRYTKFFSKKYNSSDIFIRATDTNRTQTTARIAMTAVYSSKVLWSDDMKYVPVVMNVTSFHIDPNLAVINCGVLRTHFLEMIQSKNPKAMQAYEPLLDMMSKEVGFSLIKLPVVMFGLYDIFTSQQSVGMPLSDVSLRLFPTIQQAAGIAIDYMFGNQTYVPLQAGALLKEFFETADQIISGAKIPKIRVLSGHDFNVYMFTAATRAVPRQGAPRYCSVFSLELRRCKISGKYVVVPVYVRSPEEPESYLEIEECGVICDYEKFRNLTAKNVLTEQQYKKRCRPMKIV